MVTDDLPRALDQLASLGRATDMAIRPVLLRVMVDLFVGKPHHLELEIQQFQEIVSHILDDADAQTRMVVADKLAQHPQAPRDLLARLGHDRRGAARGSLEPTSLDPASLPAVAVLGTTETAVAAAGRADLDADTTRSLAERPEREVIQALAANAAAPIEAGVMRYLTRRARQDLELATTLLGRPDATPVSASLFLAATRAQRAELMAEARRHDLGTVTRTLPVPVSVEAGAAIERASRLPGWEGLDVTLGALLGLSRSEIDRVMDDPGGEPLALALTAVGTSVENAGRLFILGEWPIRLSYERVKALVAIVQNLSPHAAYRLLMTMLGRPSPTLRHQAAQRADEGQPRRSFGSAARAEAGAGGSAPKAPAKHRL